MNVLDDSVDVSGKRVLVRSDMNVPMTDGRITDDGRIRASAPTIRGLAERGARVIVMAHLGRPKGSRVPDLSLEPVAARLGEILEIDVAFSDELTGEDVSKRIDIMGDGDVLLLENVRFDERETSKDDAARAELAQQLARNADLFVSDGFGVVHRKQASVYDVAKLLPSYAGDLVAAEVEVLRKLTDSPERPYTVVLGGSKVSDKLGVIDNLLDVADNILIGGGMMFTFLAAQGHEVGKSLLESDQLDTVRGYVKRAAEAGVELIVPTDTIAASAFSADADRDRVPVEHIPADRMGLDIGPDTAAKFANIIERSGTIFWNGPMGVFEMEPFAGGTLRVAKALTEAEGFSVVGGGDSAAAVRQLGFSDDQFGHVSTGGGASLEYLEGKSLPGLEVLES